MKLEITPAALEDLRSIRKYTQDKWGLNQEEAYLNGMWEKFESIQLNSAKFRFRHDLFPQCQIASQGKHIILFRTHKKVLQIVRVLHATMDLKRHFP